MRWIPAFAGMTADGVRCGLFNLFVDKALPPWCRKTKTRNLDSRLRGNDSGGVRCFQQSVARKRLHSWAKPLPVIARKRSDEAIS